MIKKRITGLIILFALLFNQLSVLALETVYPDYAELFLGKDKHENYNRKMFNFNQGLNKYAIRPIHILWSSIMPEYGIERLRGFSNNIEYPIRLVSSLIQRDFTNAKNETKRFFINTTIGLAGLYDPARHIIKVEQSRENMDQAFEKCKIKSGPFFVVPVLYFTTVRGLFGRLFDMALNPSFYIGTPLMAVIKACLVINRTSYFQPILKMIESNYADPYEIRKIAFGIDSYIKRTNLDRVEVKSELHVDEPKEDNMVEVSKPTVILDVSAKLYDSDKIKTGAKFNKVLEPNLGLEKITLEPDIVLKDYNSQTPVIDSMRTALFNLPGVTKSIWNEMSLWNRSFANRIKTSSVNLAEGRVNYKFRYILQHKKNAPLAILYPSIGEGISSGHSVMFAKMFYDQGYSVVIQGNPFQWEFVKSMPEDYRPGLPAKDAEVAIYTTTKIVEKLQKEHKCKFSEKVFMGTSFGGIVTLFIAAKEAENNTLGNTKYIAVCPPVDLIYAMNQVDKNTQECLESAEDLKYLIGITSAKILRLFQIKNDINFVVNNLPFTDEEAKLITGFIMHQKLADLIFTIENTPNNHKSDIYTKTNNMGYREYAAKYLLSQNAVNSDEDLYKFGLIMISDYLERNNNYKIYHSMNDYLINKNHLKQLKMICGDKSVLLDNGAHLGFLYRSEFLGDLAKTITAMK